MFWGFGAKIKPAFCDVWSVGVVSVELSDWVLVEMDCSFLDGEVPPIFYITRNGIIRYMVINYAVNVLEMYRINAQHRYVDSI